MHYFDLFFDFCLTELACFIFHEKNYFVRCLPQKNLPKIFAIFACKNSGGIFIRRLTHRTKPLHFSEFCLYLSLV